MRKCDICRVSTNDLNPVYDLCRVCYGTCAELSRMKDIGFSRAMHQLRDALEEHPTPKSDWGRPAEPFDIDLVLEDDETLDIVRVNNNPLSSEDYREMEYDFLNLYIPNPFFVNRNDEINWLNELLDAALLGGDTKWARELNNRIKQVKGAINQ